MTNAEWMIKNGMSFENLHIRRSDNHYYEIGYYVNDYDRICNESESAILNHGYTNDKDVDVVLRWLQSEHHEPILDDVERKYLSAVIKPFRDKIEYIAKVREEPLPRFYKNDGIIKYYISIHFNDENDDTAFPLFREDAMYKGMEPYREYTLEELGL